MFCNWIAYHDTDPSCDYQIAGDCLLCIFNRDLHLYWREEKPMAGIEIRHDKEFNHAAGKMTASEIYSRWKSLKETEMADCNEFMARLVDNGFPSCARNSFYKNGRLQEDLMEIW